jgi:hypothetical protein
VPIGGRIAAIEEGEVLRHRVGMRAPRSQQETRKVGVGKAATHEQAWSRFDLRQESIHQRVGEILPFSELSVSEDQLLVPLLL